MKNTTLIETDTEDKKIFWLVPAPEGMPGENGQCISKPRPANRHLENLIGARELVKQLLGVVNSESEYDMLLEDLAELDAIIASQSIKLNGGDAK